MESAKKICFERDAGRCRHCGTDGGIDVYQLHKRGGRLAWHLTNLIVLCNDCNAKAESVKNNPNTDRVGVILCGGRGTRLSPSTSFSNKHELPVGLIPMVMYPIKTLQHFRVKRVLVVVDRLGYEKIPKILGSGCEFGMDISYKVQEGASGIASALYMAKDFVKNEKEVLCILGDNIFDNTALDVDAKIDEETKAYVWLKEVNEPGHYGVAEIKNSKVVGVEEKPSHPKSNLAVVGLYLYDAQDVFCKIDKVEPSERGETEISSINNQYAQSGQLGFGLVGGYWGDAGGSIWKYAECSMHGAKQANVSPQDIDNFKALVFDEK